jgi:hypothetical protein
MNNHSTLPWYLVPKVPHAFGFCGAKFVGFSFWVSCVYGFGFIGLGLKIKKGLPVETIEIYRRSGFG